MRSQFNVFFIVLAALLAGTACAEQYILKGSFVERRAQWEFGHLKGQFFYLYDSADANKCRLRFDYSLSYINGSIISNLYHYEHGAMYSLCSEKCTGLKVTEKPDPWWLSGDLYSLSGSVHDGMAWYTRNSAHYGNSTEQVTSLLMKVDSNAPTNGYLKCVVFADGRNVTFSDVVVNPGGVSAADPIFEPTDKCPQPTCPIFADIVFVLDSSGSVTNTEWAQTVRFVDEVMKLFTFGKNAVAAAVVQFNGQDDGCKNTSQIYEPDCKNKKRYKGDCVYPSPWRQKTLDPDLMATVKAGVDYGEGLTLSYNREELMREMDATVRDDCVWPPNGNTKQCQAFAGWRGTCQALGLDLAMKVLDRSPRRNYNTKPNNIVIVVTDGEDKYPNMTALNATIIKAAPYNAFLIEVGVGLECDYDRRYLRSIASELGAAGEGAYFNADDYTKIKDVVDQLFRPLCDSDYSSGCGPECKGFCGCGECLCPDCDESLDICHMIQCNVSGSYSNGCVKLEEKYPIDDDICTTYLCDETKDNPSSQKTGEWYAYVDPCTQMREDYPGECRNVYCDTGYGGCRVEVNNSYCRQFSTACEEWECTPLNEIPEDTVTGCRVAPGKNHTKTCEEALGARSACMAIVCDGSSSLCSDMEVDLCTSRNDACYTWACSDVGNGEYDCVPTMTSSVVNDSCTTWVCDPSQKSGWKISLDRDEDYCANAYHEQHTADPDPNEMCLDFHCNPSYQGDIEGGCYYTNRSGCASECNETKELSCKAESMDESTDTHCIFDFCIVVHEGDSHTLDCASNNNSALIENCRDPNSASAKRAKELNEANPKVCWTPSCAKEKGKCTIIEVQLPDSYKYDNCTEPRCILQDDGSWDWEMKPTKIADACNSDPCYNRECVPDTGCVVRDICTVNTNECYSYSCVTDDEGKPQCQETDLTKDFLSLECMSEICQDGKKVPIYSDCVPEDKCMKGTCIKGYCNYTPRAAPGNDLCIQYSCDPATGDWSYAPQCDDGLHCTIDECWNYGTFFECHFDHIDCSQSLNMDGYDCFRPVCKEDLNKGSFKCMRKLIPNAYIDICGQCIKDNPYGQDDRYSYSYSVVKNESAADAAIYSCTGAPPKPLMVETLAAATVALIIIAAIIVGAGLTTSSIMATKSLVDRARQANNQAAQTNPLYEGVDTELQNPTYAGGN